MVKFATFRGLSVGTEDVTTDVAPVVQAFKAFVKVEVQVLKTWMLETNKGSTSRFGMGKATH
jgi:hypothetical protein